MPRNSPLSPAARAAELVLPENSAPLDPVAIFGRAAPLEVDLGCGDGTVLAAMAAQHRERDFLGIEQLRGRAAGACRKIAHAGLTNARILRADIATVAELLPACSVRRFHLLFPDPWPKRRHAVRRVVTSDWLRSVCGALEAGGAIRLVTDDRGYFTQMERALAGVSELRAEGEMESEEFPRGTFEAHFRALGTPIYRVGGRKISDLR